MPVAKVVSADILHKSDIGGVVLNLKTAAEVRKAFGDIANRVKKLKGKPKLEGVLIAQQVKADLELVVGASLDAAPGGASRPSAVWMDSPGSGGAAHRRRWRGPANSQRGTRPREALTQGSQRSVEFAGDK